MYDDQHTHAIIEINDPDKNYKVDTFYNITNVNGKYKTDISSNGKVINTIITNNNPLGPAGAQLIFQIITH